MTGPHQLCYVNCGLPADECSCYRDIMSRAGDPAALAALPEVQALIAAAYEVAAQVVDTRNAEGPYQAIGAACRIRSLTPADATAALARIVREAEARGMERAADRARVYASNYEQSSDGRNTFILLAEWADAEAAAILARADQIERDATNGG